jgi:hypothetical protein
MERNKPSGPDGFPVEFCQNFLEVIKVKIMEMFEYLHVGKLNLFQLNFEKITLLPKINEAERIQQYRLICLLNVSFKIFTKTTTNRLNSVGDHVARPTQSAFMKERNILDGVLILHEMVHELHRKK